MKDRIRHNDPQGLISTHIIDSKTSSHITPNTVFHFGQVISVKDKNNTNRIKVRIPLIDDVLYNDDKGNYDRTIGDSRLSWCIPAQSRVVDTPEVNSVVLVALLNSKKPYNGRIWFSSIKFESNKEIFENCTPEGEGIKAWEEVEKNVGFAQDNYPTKRGNKIPNKNSSINFLVGIKGKSNNKLLFDEKETLLIQDEGKRSEAKLILSKLIELKGRKIDVLSTNSSKTHRPVFADPLFSYLMEVQTILLQISTLLTTKPGLVILPIPGSPIGPSPEAPAIAAATTNAQKSLAQLQIPGRGKSQFIKIN
jgi:hypothetical protein